MASLEDDESGDWWVKVGGFHFNGYLSVFTVLVVFLAILLAVTWVSLLRQRRTSGFESLKTNGLKDDLGTLKRVCLISLVLVVYNGLSVVYFNHLPHNKASLRFAEYAFSLLCMFVGKWYSTKVQLRSSII